MRIVTGRSPLGANTAVQIALFDRYLHPLGVTVETTADEDSNFEVSLQINDNNCWVIANTPQIPFFVYEGEGVLRLEDALLERRYPAFEKTEGMEIKNFNLLINKYLQGDPIVSNEDKRILCDFFAFASAVESRDARICNIDKEL